MRIAFITPEFVSEEIFDGGLANYLYRVSLALKKLGHEPIILVSSNKNEIIYYNEIEVHRIAINSRWLDFINKLTFGKLSTTFYWLWQSFKLNKALKKINSEKNLSIIQYTSYTATGIFKLTGIPSVIRISSYEPLLNKAYEQVNNSFDQTITYKLEKIAFKKANGLFGPSKLLAKIIEKDLSINVKVIESPFLLEGEKIDEKPYQDLLEGKRYLLFFGSIGILKGVLIISEIIKVLLQNNPNLYFVFIGKDVGYKGKPMMQHLWEKAGSYRGRVIYLGKMRHEQLYPIIKNAQAVVLPSRIDNFPNVCLEAMAHKKIVIGTKGTSFEQLLEDDTSGFLCQKDDPKDLLLAIEKALNLKEEQKRDMEQKAFQRIQILKPERVVSELVNYYLQIMNQFGSIKNG